jgi:hypothetical protein
VVLAVAIAGYLVTHEPFNERYCPSEAIGYLREVKSGVVVAGGDARYDHISRHGYDLRAWFPANRSEAQVLMLMWKGDDIGINMFEGRGYVRMHYATRTYCAFGNEVVKFRESFPGFHTSPPGPKAGGNVTAETAKSPLPSPTASGADTRPTIPAPAIPAVKCLHGLFDSSQAVQSAELYVIDQLRSAIEYRFVGKNGKVITADLMLLASTRPTYDITIQRPEPEAAGWEALDFFTSLNASSKCRLSAASDSLIPGPKPRAEWQHIDWSTLLPVPRPSPTSLR